jgi:hypothetical protein
MPFTCPSCNGAVDPGSLNPVAQTGHCAQCGQVRPKVELSTGPVAEWLFTWHKHGEGVGVVARHQKHGVKGLVGLVASLILAAFGVFPVALGARVFFVLLGAVLAMANALRLRPRSVRLTRQQFAWHPEWSPFVRSEQAERVIGFFVEKRKDSEGGEYFVLTARVAGHNRVTLCSDQSSARLQPACDRLNEALFLVMGAPSKTGPYR